MTAVTNFKKCETHVLGLDRKNACLKELCGSEAHKLRSIATVHTKKLIGPVTHKTRQQLFMLTA